MEDRLGWLPPPDSVRAMPAELHLADVPSAHAARSPWVACAFRPAKAERRQSVRSAHPASPLGRLLCVDGFRAVSVAGGSSSASGGFRPQPQGRRVAKSARWKRRQRGHGGERPRSPRRRGSNVPPIVSSFTSPAVFGNRRKGDQFRIPVGELELTRPLSIGIEAWRAGTVQGPSLRATRAAPSSGRSGLVTTCTGHARVKSAYEPLSLKAARKPPAASRGSSLGAMPPAR